MGAGASPPRMPRERSRSPPRAAGAAAAPAPGRRWERGDDGGGDATEQQQREHAQRHGQQQRGRDRRAQEAEEPPRQREDRGGPRRRTRDDVCTSPSGAERAPAAAPPPPPSPPPPIYKPDFAGLSGKLAAEANTVNGVVLKFAPPAEARVCRDPRWRMYVFKETPGGGGGGGGEGGGGGGGSGGGRPTSQPKKQQQQRGEPVGEPIPLDRHPYYLFGKERRVADVPTDHPSCSRQHAVVCFREVERLPEGGLLPSAGGGGGGGAAGAAALALAASRRVVPYLVDLEAANGTFLNGERVGAGRFYELLDGDVVKFGASTREYVFIRER